MRGLYILNEAGEPEPCEDPVAWAMWMTAANRRVALDEIGEVRVSTVFLGLDLSVEFRSGAPVLWETMIFGGIRSTFARRYASRADALAGHAKALAMVERELTQQ